MVIQTELTLLAAFACFPGYRDKPAFLEYLSGYAYPNRPGELSKFLQLCDPDAIAFKESVDALSDDDKKKLLIGVRHYSLFQFLSQRPSLTFNSVQIASKISQYLSELGIENVHSGEEIQMDTPSKYKWMGLLISQ